VNCEFAILDNAAEAGCGDHKIFYVAVIIVVVDCNLIKSNLIGK